MSSYGSYVKAIRKASTHLTEEPFIFYKSTFLMQNIARELHKSVKNKERGANLHKSVIGDLWIRSIFAI